MLVVLSTNKNVWQWNSSSKQNLYHSNCIKQVLFLANVQITTNMLLLFVGVFVEHFFSCFIETLFSPCFKRRVANFCCCLDVVVVFACLSDSFSVDKRVFSAMFFHLVECQNVSKGLPTCGRQVALKHLEWDPFDFPAQLEILRDLLLALRHSLVRQFIYTCSQCSGVCCRSICMR